VKRAAVAVIVVALAGCGYVGDPLPPALNIPMAVADVRAVERGGDIIVEFSRPLLSTEKLPFKEPPKVEVFAGPIPDPFSAESWAATAKPVEEKFPAGTWVGQKIAIAVRSTGPSGRLSAWSNFTPLTVIPPIPTPAGWSLEGVPQGVKVVGPPGAAKLRVFRQTEADTEPRFLSAAPGRDWTDSSAEFGKKYSYRIQVLAAAGEGEAESEISGEQSITYEDKFAPAPVAGLTAIPGVNSVELAWDRGTEADLKGYQVYRAAENAPFEKLGEVQPNPSFRDTGATPGKKYRYRVTALDQAGNESTPSEPVEIIAP
jgi:hypothetical protein